MIIVTIVLVVAIWCWWVEYEANKDPSYNQESATNPDADWPFPTAKRP